MSNVLKTFGFDTAGQPSKMQSTDLISIISSMCKKHLQCWKMNYLCDTIGDQTETNKESM
jgi:hypothetical protein